MLKKNLVLPLIVVFLVGSMIGGYMAWQANRDSVAAVPEDTQTTANEGLSNLSDVTSGSAAFQFDLGSMPLGSTDAFTANLKGTLDFDTSRPDQPLSLLSMDAVIETPQGTATYNDLAFLQSAKKTFFSLNDLSLDRPENVVLGTPETYNPKWYEVSSSRNPLSIFPYLSSLGVLGTNLEQGFDIAGLQIALNDSSLFEGITQLKDEQVDNVDTYHYSFSGLNKEQAAVILSQMSKPENPADATAVTALQDQLQQFNLTGEIWVSKAGGTVKKITLAFTPAAAGTAGITLGVTINLTDLNRPVTIPQVQDAGDFDTFLTTIPALKSAPDASASTIEELTSDDKLPQLP